MSKILKNNSPGDLNGFLDTGCEVQGDLRFDNSFRIHGKFKGTVESEGELIVGEGGVVEGVFKLGQLSVSGRLEGRVEASKRIEIGVNGHVEGEIRSPVLVIASGAFFQGECRMSPSEPARPAVAGSGKAATEGSDPALQRFAIPGGGSSSAGSVTDGGSAGRSE